MVLREIVLIGERDLSKRAHAGIEASIALFQRDFDPTLTFRWVPTAEVAASTPAQSLGSATGIWCVPGSPYESTDGALQAIRFARENQRVFFGTCGGFQHALMEFCQNVVGRNAAHQEMDGEATDPLIVKLTCSLEGAKGKILAADGSWFAEVLGGIESVEEFNCNYGLASSLESVFAGSDLEFVARDEVGQVRAFRLATHRFFVGTLFQPERRALGGVLHPLVYAFLKQASRSRMAHSP
jgi:CTP synthase (UTP-ammonia lyase)